MSVMNTFSIPHPLVLFACFFVFFSQAQADQITLYPVQSGLVSDGSCCSPYIYSNNDGPSMKVTDCFNSTYGCHFRKDYAAWRWDVSGSLPEDVHIQSALLRWEHPDDCFSSWTDIWIDATSNSLTSNYLSGMPADQIIIDYQYWASMVTMSVEASIITDALTEGFVSVKIGNGEGADGCTFINEGASAPRLIIFYQEPETPCPGDLSGDRLVDGSDISMVLGYWGQDDPAYDLDGNGLIDGADLAIVLGWWGVCPE
jgi:hypothetical protein